MSKSTRTPQAQQDAFFARLSNPRSLLGLFDVVPGVYLYIKDIDGRFILGNQTVCEVVGVDRPEDLIGKTDVDFFPPAIATQYIAEDRRVIESQEPLSDQVWMVPGQNGVPRVYLCSKIPLFDKKNKVAGIAGLKRPYEYSADESSGASRLVRVIAYVSKNYAKDIGVPDMAEQALLSVSQLQREFSKHFGITPIRYLREVRIGVVRHMLENSDLPVSQISAACGFYDQSHLTRHFQKSTGLTPLKYRKRYGTTAD
jgi:AraC-like DNA-binding protein